MRAHLLTFNDTEISREDVIRKIDDVASIANWSAFLPGSICLISPLPARELARQIREHLPGTHFLVVELEHGKKNGWLPKQVWSFMNDPKAVA